MTDLEHQLTDHLRRRAAAATPRYDLEGIEQHTDLASLVDLDGRRSRPRTIRLLVIAACLLAVIALAALVMTEDQSVDTVPPSESPTTQSSTATSEAGGPTILAKGQDIELAGESGFGNQTLDIDVKADHGVVTGEFRVSANVIRVDCVDTLYTEGAASLYEDRVIILGGEVTEGPDLAVAGEDVLVALIIREGDADGVPDSVALYPNDSGAGSCTELLKSIPDDLPDELGFVDVEDGYDIETG